MVRRLLIGVIAGIAALAVVPLAVADGTETLGPPSVPIASGTGVVTAGAGMHNFAGTPNTVSVTVPAGATVQQVLLYWTGHHSAPDFAAGDDTISVNGSPVTGTLIGGPRAFFNQMQGVGEKTETFSTYRADITSRNLVGAGANTLTISDMMFRSNFFATGDFNGGNDGVGVMVIYRQANTPTATIGVRDGQDLAFYAFAPPLDTTVPQTFSFPSRDFARSANLATMVGSVLGPDAFHGTNRGTLMRLTFDVGGTLDIENPWQSFDGFEFDAINTAVTIPAGASSLTVQALSHATSLDWNPASLNWLVAALSIEGDAPPPPPPLKGETATGAGFNWSWTQGAPSTWFMYTPWVQTKVNGITKPGISPSGVDLIAGQHYVAGRITGTRTSGPNSTSITITLNSGWGFEPQASNVKINPMNCTSSQRYVQPGGFTVHRTATASASSITVSGLANTACYGIHVDVVQK